LLQNWQTWLPSYMVIVTETFTDLDTKLSHKDCCYRWNIGNFEVKIIKKIFENSQVWLKKVCWPGCYYLWQQMLLFVANYLWQR
jgi:hypothetical protein